MSEEKKGLDRLADLKYWELCELPDEELEKILEEQDFGNAPRLNRLKEAKDVEGFRNLLRFIKYAFSAIDEQKKSRR